MTFAWDTQRSMRGGWDFEAIVLKDACRAIELEWVGAKH
jgi:hypothetical protein